MGDLEPREHKENLEREKNERCFLDDRWFHVSRLLPVSLLENCNSFTDTFNFKITPCHNDLLESSYLGFEKKKKKIKEGYHKISKEISHTSYGANIFVIDDPRDDDFSYEQN